VFELSVHCIIEYMRESDRRCARVTLAAELPRKPLLPTRADACAWHAAVCKCTAAGAVCASSIVCLLDSLSRTDHTHGALTANYDGVEPNSVHNRSRYRSNRHVTSRRHRLIKVEACRPEVAFVPTQCHGQVRNLKLEQVATSSGQPQMSQ
jgi:hypothetical protein